jgi:hypothetical protein
LIAAIGQRIMCPMRKTATSSGVDAGRRTALKAIGTVVALPWLSDEGLLAFARLQESNAASQLKVLSRSQFEALEVLTEAIIPTDERSPGAKQARVADYVDLLLGEVDREVVLQWIGGLAALDAEAMSRFRSPFSRLRDTQVDAILQTISRNEKLDKTAQTPLEAFFVMVKQATVRGYYTSKIGIHDELRYKGNQFLREFVGCRTEDGQDCPHCGQKHHAG